MNIDPKKTMSLTEARKNIFDIAKDVQKPGSHYVFTENGRPKAVMMSVEDFDSWQETIEVYRQFPNIEDDTKQAHKELSEGNTISLDELLAEQGLVVADKGSVEYASRSDSKKRKKRSK